MEQTLRVGKRLLLICLSSLLYGCSLYSIPEHTTPDLEIPSEFFYQEAVQADPAARSFRWWEEFQDPQLNTLMQRTLSGNLTLKAAWNRLQQAEALTSTARSEQYPQVTLSGSATRTRSENGAVTGGLNIPGGGADSTTYFNDFVAGAGLSYEIDLWRRIASQVDAAQQNVVASRADLENTALLLSGTVAELWFQAQEQQARIDLLERQIKVSEQLLELTSLRFSVGRGTAVSVLQQRQQLAATRTELPAARAQLETTLGKLAVLTGTTRGGLADITPDGNYPELPPFPALASPVDLLTSRPDVRAARNRLLAAEYDIASKVAARLPRVVLGPTYNFRASDISDLFDTALARLIGDVSLPIIDGGRRRAEVRRADARAKELANDFAATYLTALQDVESAVIEEKYQRETLDRVNTQLAAARSTLQETQSRYSNGLSEYLDVTIALQALQQVERREVTEKRALFVTRSKLYRALGGDWLRTLDPDHTSTLEEETT